jgi:hypothetical protein
MVLPEIKKQKELKNQTITNHLCDLARKQNE